MLCPAINLKLLTSLIPVDLPKSDYKAWVRKVSRVVAKLEAYPSYNSDSNTKTWYTKGAPGLAYLIIGRKLSPSRDRPQT